MIPLQFFVEHISWRVVIGLKTKGFTKVVLCGPMIFGATKYTKALTTEKIWIPSDRFGRRWNRTRRRLLHRRCSAPVEWPNWAQIETMWQDVTRCDKMWQGWYWNILKHIETYWNILKHIETYWNILKPWKIPRTPNRIFCGSFLCGSTVED